MSIFDKIESLTSHSTFWLAVCSIILNLLPLVSAEFADYPEVMRWSRITVAVAWVTWLYLSGKLPDPVPPTQKEKA